MKWTLGNCAVVAISGLPVALFAIAVVRYAVLAVTGN